MRISPRGRRVLWGSTAAAVVLWVACFVVFSDSCLSLGGAGVSCRSMVDYPEFLLIAAVFGVVLLIPVIAVLALAALVATLMAKRRPPD